MPRALDAAASRTKDHEHDIKIPVWKACRFWNCKKNMISDHDLCFTHYRLSINNAIDICSKCNKYKENKFTLCANCRYNNRKKKINLATISNIEYKLEHSHTWGKADENAKVFYVYILKLNGGDFYAGQTRELRERLSEHQDGKVKSTWNREPKLVWYAEVPTRYDATNLERKLKKAINQKPRAIRKMIMEFRDLIRELDFG